MQCCYGEGQDADHYEAWTGSAGQCVGCGGRTEACHVPYWKGEFGELYSVEFAMKCACVISDPLPHCYSGMCYKRKLGNRISKTLCYVLLNG